MSYKILLKIWKRKHLFREWLKDKTKKGKRKKTLTDFECPVLYSTHGGKAKVLFKPCAKAKAPRKWSAWLPNLPKILKHETCVISQ